MEITSEERGRYLNKVKDTSVVIARRLCDKQDLCHLVGFELETLDHGNPDDVFIRLSIKCSTHCYFVDNQSELDTIPQLAIAEVNRSSQINASEIVN